MTQHGTQISEGAVQPGEGTSAEKERQIRSCTHSDGTAENKEEGRQADIVCQQFSSP